MAESAQIAEPAERASPWVLRCAPLVPAGARVLDLACGGGRHTALFVARGHEVTALDRDIAKLGSLADHPSVEAVEADLEDGSPWPLGDRVFGGVVVTNYLWRPILPRIVGAVAPGGVLLYETFAAGNERFGRPRNPDFLLRSGELLEAGAELQRIAYEHGLVERPAKAMVQRLCARRPD